MCGLTEGVEVIDPADTSLDDILWTRPGQDHLVVADHGEALLPDAHGGFEGCGPGFGLEDLLAVPRGYLDIGGRFQHGHDEDHVIHGFPAVGPAHEVIAGAVVCGHHAGVRGVAVCAARRGSIPVDQLFFFDIFVDG